MGRRGRKARESAVCRRSKKEPERRLPRRARRSAGPKRRQRRARGFPEAEDGVLRAAGRRGHQHGPKITFHGRYEQTLGPRRRFTEKSPAPHPHPAARFASARNHAPPPNLAGRRLARADAKRPRPNRKRDGNVLNVRPPLARRRGGPRAAPRLGRPCSRRKDWRGPAHRAIRLHKGAQDDQALRRRPNARPVRRMGDAIRHARVDAIRHARVMISLQNVSSPRRLLGVALLRFDLQSVGRVEVPIDQLDQLGVGGVGVVFAAVVKGALGEDRRGDEPRAGEPARAQGLAEESGREESCP
mmetsp:Transcript_2732/g.9683  ORF Transcript_2732/g.9683 Transcript_2732/m.9683 type:complete len:300 (-) Transcript_2732:982-1881(-)